jgi:hypothetical protein
LDVFDSYLHDDPANDHLYAAEMDRFGVLLGLLEGFSGRRVE